MNRFLRFLDKEANSLHQAAFLLASASLGAKLLAIVRDRLLAGSFGAGKALDIYFASFRLPDFLYVFSLFVVSTTALIPFILKKQPDQRWSFVNQIFTIFFFFMLVLLTVAFFAVPRFVNIIAPGFSEADLGMLIKFSRILLLSPFLLGLSNLVSSVIQSFNRFFVYALSGVFYNVGIILGLLLLYPIFGFAGIIWGVVLGALLHFSIQIPSLVSLGYFPKFTFRISFSEIKKVVVLSFPRTLGLTLNQLVILGITALASFLAAGSIAVFNLALNLETIPLGIIGLSYSVAAFPSLAKSYINQQKQEFLSAVISGFRHILFWLLPISTLFVVLRAQIVRVVLGAGAFSWADTRLTAAALALFSFSIFAQGLILLLVRAFYAAGKTRLPLFVNIVSSVLVIVLAIVFLLCFKHCPCVLDFFEKLLRVDDVSGVLMLALPLAYSLGMIINFFLLFLFFEREFGVIPDIKKSAGQMIFVSLLMGFIAYWTLVLWSIFFSLETFMSVFAQGFLAGLLSLIVGFFALRILKNREIDELISSLKKKFYKKALVKPEPEELP